MNYLKNKFSGSEATGILHGVWINQYIVESKFRFSVKYHEIYVELVIYLLNKLSHSEVTDILHSSWTNQYIIVNKFRSYEKYHEIYVELMIYLKKRISQVEATGILHCVCELINFKLKLKYEGHFC